MKPIIYFPKREKVQVELSLEELYFFHNACYKEMENALKLGLNNTYKHSVESMNTIAKMIDSLKSYQ